MSYDNRIISSEPYIVNTINTDNRISKRPKKKSPSYRNNKQNSPNTFEETPDSFPNKLKHEDNNKENPEFKNQLYNLSLAKNKTIIKKLYSNNKDSSSNDSTKKIVNSELHYKIREAMNVEVDVSSIYEKIKQLNLIKKEPQS